MLRCPVEEKQCYDVLCARLRILPIHEGKLGIQLLANSSRNEWTYVRMHSVYTTYALYDARTLAQGLPPPPTQLAYTSSYLLSATVASTICVFWVPCPAIARTLIFLLISLGEHPPPRTLPISRPKASLKSLPNSCFTQLFILVTNVSEVSSSLQIAPGIDICSHAHSVHNICLT
jgi:hypothetical protein